MKTAPNQLKKAPATQAGTQLPLRPFSGHYVSKHMVKIFTLVGLFLMSLASVSQEFEEPVVSPQDASELVLQYLATEYPDIDISAHNFVSLSFNYIHGHWSAFFECKDPGLSCHFSVRVSNESQPKFTFYPGL